MAFLGISRHPVVVSGDIDALSMLLDVPRRSSTFLDVPRCFLDVPSMFPRRSSTFLDVPRCSWCSPGHFFNIMGRIQPEGPHLQSKTASMRQFCQPVPSEARNCEKHALWVHFGHKSTKSLINQCVEAPSHASAELTRRN